MLVEGINNPTHSFVSCFYLLLCVSNSIFRRFDHLRSKVLKDVVDKFSANSSRRSSEEERRERSTSNQRLESHAIIITSFNCTIKKGSAGEIARKSSIKGCHRF